MVETSVRGALESSSMLRVWKCKMGLLNVGVEGKCVKELDEEWKCE